MTAPSEMKTASFEVFADNLPKLREKVAELNRKIDRLAKKGYALAHLALSEGASRTVKVRHHDAHGNPVGNAFDAIKVAVSLQGPTVRAAGWEFVASLQHEEAGNILRAVPGFAGLDLSAYRTAPPSCAHCGKNIRRKDTFVLRAVETGALQQVGRNCLADFLGIDPFGYAAAAEFLATLRGCADDWDGDLESGGSASAWDLSAYLTFVACAIRTDGWLSRTKARENGGTASADVAIYCGVCDPHHGDSKDSLHPSPADAALAADALTWAASYFENKASLDDYEHNLRVALLAGYATPRTAGIIASLIPCYQRTMERERLAKVEAGSAHVGEVDKRSVFPGLRLVSTRNVESFYGVSTLHKFVDAAGNILTWFCSGHSPFALGQTYDVAATVKKHDEWKGIRQTQLVRCAIAKVPAPKAAPASPGALSPAQKAAATRKANLAAKAA